jgi:outer membrane protein
MHRVLGGRGNHCRTWAGTWERSAAIWLLTGFVLPSPLLAGCQAQAAPDVTPAIAQYRAEQSADAARNGQPPDTRPAPPAGESVARPANERARSMGGGDRRALLVQPTVTTQPAPQDVLDEIPDPSGADEVFARRIERLERGTTEQRLRNNYRRAVEQARAYLEDFHKPRTMELGLSDCLRRALLHNYAIRIESYNPAISQARLVEAEAAFDVIFFLNTSYTRRDEPTPSQISPGGQDVRSIDGGFRKLLPTGMQVSTSLRQTRTEFMPEFRFQQLNPAYQSSFVTELRQPLLRGFGLDYNRAQIAIRRLDQRIADRSFATQVRQTLLDVETAYWQLVQARRNVVIIAESAGQNFVTYKNLEARREHDVNPVEINSAQARWLFRETQYRDAVRAARNTEDALKNAINDPELKLSEEIELIPTETPYLAPLAVDQLAEVRLALDERSEVEEAKLRIEQTRVQSMVAKNETLPQLDLTFSYEVLGLGNSADNSFDNLTTSRYQSYAVGAQFSYALGNRGPEAKLRAAHLQESQAIVALNRLTDNIVVEVNGAVRAIRLGYENIPSQFLTVQADERSLRAFQAQAQTINFVYLDAELGRVEQLNNSRATLLRSVTDYNIAIVRLEAAKGTLARYNNIVLLDEPVRRRR